MKNNNLIIEALEELYSRIKADVDAEVKAMEECNLMEDQKGVNLHAGNAVDLSLRAGEVADLISDLEWENSKAEATAPATAEATAPATSTLRVVRFTCKQVQEAGYMGPRTGTIRKPGYCLEDEQGIISLDGIRPYMLFGTNGKAAMQSIIDRGGFCGPVSHVATI